MNKGYQPRPMYGKRIADLRAKKRLSQEELASLASTSQKQMSRYENDVNEPTGPVLVKLAEALETTTDYLLGLTDNPDRRITGQSDLSHDEIELLTLYREKDKVVRGKVLEIIKVL